MGRLADRVIAITGASSGIGEATAKHAAGEGGAVALFARRAGRLDALAADIRSRGGRALAVPGDVTREGDVHAFIARARATFGRLDVVVCNAGIGYDGTLDDTPPDVMRRLVDTNLLGTLYTARAGLEIFRKQGFGHIIAVSSIAGRRGIGGASVYSATKAAQIGFIEGLRAEFAGSDLHASIIYPVGVDSEFREAQRRDYGRVVEGHGPRQTPESVARMIVECIVSPKPEVYPFRRAFCYAVFSVIAPGRADRLVQRFGRTVVPPGAADGE